MGWEVGWGGAHWVHINMIMNIFARYPLYIYILYFPFLETHQMPNPPYANP